MRARLLVPSLMTLLAPVCAVHAEPLPASPPVLDAPVVDAPADAPCDDQGLQRKGVQRREFLKKHRVEITAWGGFFASDLLSSSYDWGGAIGFWITEDLGVEASLLVTPFDLGVEKPLSNLFIGERFHSSTAYVLVGDLVLAIAHLKVRASERAIVHGDLAIYLGAGNTFHDTVQGLTFDGGLGLKLYPTRWLAVRFDLRDYLMTQEVVAVQRTVNDLVGTVGLSVYLP